MRKIKTLKLLLNILFYVLITIAVLILLGVITILFFDTTLPFGLSQLKIFFAMLPNVGYIFLLVPVTQIISFVFFILSVYYLKNAISPFLLGNYYSEETSKNFKKIGNIYVFIGVATILTRLISYFAMQKSIQLVGYMSLFSVLNVGSWFFIIIGLFFLIMSLVISGAGDIKEENDLTI